MAPRSNYRDQLHVGQKTVRSTYINAARQRNVVGKRNLEIELVGPFCQSSIATQDYLILEQRGETVSPVFSRLLALGSANAAAVSTTPVCRRRARCLENLDEAMETDGDVGDSDGFDDPQDYMTGDLLARRVLLVRIIGIDDEFRDAPAFLGKWRGEPGEDPATGRRRCEERGGAFGARGHARRLRDTCEWECDFGFMGSLLRPWVRRDGQHDLHTRIL